MQEDVMKEAHDTPLSIHHGTKTFVRDSGSLT